MTSADFRDAILNDATHRKAMETQATTPSFTALLESIVARRAETEFAASESKKDLDAELAKIKGIEPTEQLKNIFYNASESVKANYRKRIADFESFVESAKTLANTLPTNVVADKTTIRESAFFKTRLDFLNKIKGTKISATADDKTKEFKAAIIAAKAMSKEYKRFIDSLTYNELVMTDLKASIVTKVGFSKGGTPAPGSLYDSNQTDTNFVALYDNLENLNSLEMDAVDKLIVSTVPTGTTFQGQHQQLENGDPAALGQLYLQYTAYILKLCLIAEDVYKGAIAERDMMAATGASGEGKLMTALKELYRVVQTIEGALWSTKAFYQPPVDRMLDEQFKATRIRAQTVATGSEYLPTTSDNETYKAAADPERNATVIGEGLLASRPGFEGLR